MILKTKNEILNWLEKYNRDYQNNIDKNAYELIDIHDHINQALFNEMISKDNLPNDYFEKLKLQDHQYILNIKGNINISFKKLKEIPFQFYHIEGSFDCAHNELTSLKGSPQSVESDFDCSSNELKVLKGCTQFINGSFYCGNNQLKSLEYCPQSIGGHFYCDHNQLTYLEHCPRIVGGDFYCSHNQLTSLQYCHQHVDGNCYFFYNDITSLDYFPEKINGAVHLDNNLKLLKYKYESNNHHIQIMSDETFLNQTDFLFWHQFHLREKIMKENNQIIESIILKENKKSITTKFKKV